METVLISITDKPIDVASQHFKGILPIAVTMKRALEERYRIKVQPF